MYHIPVTYDRAEKYWRGERGDNPEDTLAAARLIKTRLREVFAYHQFYAHQDSRNATADATAGQGYIQASEYIESAEKNI